MKKITKEFKLRKFGKNYNWDGLEFPMPVNKIDKFEKHNNEIAINVLTYYNDICTLYRSKHNNERKQVNLLLICDGNKFHYTAIKNLSRLLSCSNSKHNGEQHFCINCLQGFHSEESRDKHFDYCVDNDNVKIEMLKEGIMLKFHDGQYQSKYYLFYMLILKVL